MPALGGSARRERRQTSGVGALRDRDEYVRSFAAWALGKLQLKDAIPVLRERLLEQPRRRGLEDQSIGMALARLHTPAVVEEQQQGSLFGEEVGGEALPTGLPKTKNEMLREELFKLAERVAIDRIGGAVVVTGKLRLSMQYPRSYALKERVLADRGRRCQLCGFSFLKRDGDEYAECHHLKPVSERGPDHEDNLLVVCANHHKQPHLADVIFPVGTSRPAEIAINGETIRVRWSS